MVVVGECVDGWWDEKRAVCLFCALPFHPALLPSLPFNQIADAAWIGSTSPTDARLSSAVAAAASLATALAGPIAPLLTADPSGGAARAALATPVAAVGDWLAERKGGPRAAALKETVAPLLSPRAAACGAAAASAAAAAGAALLDDFGGDPLSVCAILITLRGGVAFYGGPGALADALPPLASILSAGPAAGADAAGGASAAMAAAAASLLGRGRRRRSEGGGGGGGWSPAAAVGLSPPAWAPTPSRLLGVPPYPGAPPATLRLHVGGRPHRGLAARRGRAAALVLLPSASPPPHPEAAAALATALHARLVALDAAAGAAGPDGGHVSGARFVAACSAAAPAVCTATPPSKASATAPTDVALLSVAAEAAAAAGGSVLVRGGGTTGAWAAADAAPTHPAFSLLLRPGACDDTPAGAAAAVGSVRERVVKRMG